ncbi:MAG: hypothetical protein H7343_09515, partial [Undibacterium sp.]|nr:hypothetical protein [Opitutaceae bacterium]
RDLTAPTAFPLRTWTHVAAVLENGTSTRPLINGTVVATGTATGAPLSALSVPFGVGIAYLANGTANFSGFPGLARQVRTWSTTRTTAQISADASLALPTDRTGLVATWPLDESSGATARDLSGANRALTAPAGSLAATRLAVLEVRPLGVDNVVASSDDWRGTAALEAAYASVGAFPFVSDCSKDAAIAFELPPGGYTATVSGKNSTNGVALIEVYELP